MWTCVDMCVLYIYRQFTGNLDIQKYIKYIESKGFLGGSAVQNSPTEATGDGGLTPGSGRSPGGGHGNLFQYSRLENPMDRGAWWVAVHRVAQSRT